MFLLRDGSEFVFLRRNPRHEGFAGEVEEDVNFYCPRAVHAWPDGERRPQVCLGVSPRDPKSYRVFRLDEECTKAGYKKVADGNPSVFESWSDYTLNKIQDALMPEHAKEYLAINLETGEYVLGQSSQDVSRAFWARWPDKAYFKCRVDGGPAVRFRGK